MEILDLIPPDNDVAVENHYLETWKIRANLPPQNQNAQKKSFIGDLCSVSWKYVYVSCMLNTVNVFIICIQNLSGHWYLKEMFNKDTIL